MGEKYVFFVGEILVVAAVICEYYMFILVEGEFLESKVGVVFVIVDKLDMILSFFLVGLILLGFNDFYVFCCVI